MSESVDGASGNGWQRRGSITDLWTGTGYSILRERDLCSGWLWIEQWSDNRERSSWTERVRCRENQHAEVDADSGKEIRRRVENVTERCKVYCLCRCGLHNGIRYIYHRIGWNRNIKAAFDGSGCILCKRDGSTIRLYSNQCRMESDRKGKWCLRNAGSSER